MPPLIPTCWAARADGEFCSAEERTACQRASMNATPASTFPGEPLELAAETVTPEIVVGPAVTEITLPIASRGTLLAMLAVSAIVTKPDPAPLIVRVC